MLFTTADLKNCPACGRLQPLDTSFCRCGGDYLDSPGGYPPQGGAPDPFGYQMYRHQDAGWTNGTQSNGVDMRETRVGNTLVRIAGNIVPQVEVALSPGDAVYFEHHILLWKHPQVNIDIKPLKGALKRMMAGMQIFVTQATGPGSIAFSRDDAGEIIPIHIRPGEELHVREHQFLAATSSIDYSFFRVKGVANILFGGTGFWIDRFVAPQQPGLLLLHGYGNVYEVMLRPGEAIDVEPGGFLYKDASVQMTTVSQRLSTGFLGGFNLFMNRFVGPGRVGIQTMYVHLPTAE
ncbi:AIM24 family protein (plasmid) [Candidatus Chlorohelix allophototropha]|uniref:AIM24 family protein n=2 Tax=Candidatus Chlorohelix allophototropha TaxID=3003348 RepID=A0ABY9BAB5_9CHLR|nr:AIM24 family protein [Chloroflexota bacterium L227-S17]